MVQVVENRSALSGVVEQVESANGGLTVTLRVERADPVPGVANLLADRVGGTVTLMVPPSGGDVPPQPGDRIRCHARLAGPQRYFAIPGSIQPD